MKHPRTPWYAKAVGALTLLYALAPIDLIPDFIPVIGYLDDFVLVPAGLWITIKLVPPEVWAECEAEAARLALEKPPKDWRGVILIVVLWITLAALGYRILRALNSA
ncbi:MAG: DUF1232 domain-containing protein [Planctomycetota bacterium]|nr:DUF1232 domain-containing protein [Planctomycetota bacterium]